MFWRRRALSLKELFSLAPLVVSALVISADGDWVAQSNRAFCVFSADQHYSPALQEIAQQIQVAISQANVALWLAAGLFLLGTFLTARVFVCGWRSKRQQEAQ
jgi:hypothetical protein